MLAASFSYCLERMSERSLFRSARIDQHRLSHPNVTCFLWKSSILPQWLWNKKYSKQSGSLTSFHPRKKNITFPQKKGTFSNHHLFLRRRTIGHRRASATPHPPGEDEKIPPCFKGLCFFLGTQSRGTKNGWFFTAKLIKHTCIENIYIYTERERRKSSIFRFYKDVQKEWKKYKKRKVNSFVFLDQSSNHPLSGVFHFWGGHLIWE